MTLASVFFGVMAITIRYASHQLHPFEVAFFRNVFGLLFALPILHRTGLGILRTNKLPFYFFRCAIGLVSMLAGFWAIAHLPLAQAVALSYSSPLFVTVLAVFLLGEVVRVRRWTAVLVGFFGVLIIVRPTADGFTYGALVALLAAAMSASTSISIKYLSRTESSDAIVLYTTLIWAPLSLFPALFVWQAPTPASWCWVALAGLLGTAGHMAWTRALRLGDVSALTPINYVQLPVVALLAYFLFDESLDRYTALGSAVIFLANLYIARRELALSRRTVTDPAVAREGPTA
jgi:drug/metabolite transporter (DMT)-like permease